EAFVCQPLLVHLEPSEVIKSRSQGKSKSEELAADDLLRKPATLALLGASETGRTSLLHYLSIRVSEGVCDRSRIPAIVSIPLAAKSGYDRALHAYYSRADMKFSAIAKAIKTLDWIVFLDDFNCATDGHMALLADIRAK